MDLTPAKLQWNGNLPRSTQYEDVYFSTEDGLAETQAVFLSPNKLQERFTAEPHTVVGELGFGTGLNFLATWALHRSVASSHTRLTFISTEAHLLKVDEFERAHRAFPKLAAFANSLREQLPSTHRGFHRLSFDNGRVVLLLLLGDANNSLTELHAGVDAWFLDGFAPAKNPKMWTPEIFGQMARLSTNGTTLSTWCSAGAVRRGLSDAGFQVQRVEGHAGKRHRTIGTMLDPKPDGHRPPWLIWPTSNSPKTAAVMGAGLAGSTIARALHQRGIAVTVYDAAHTPATGGSGNPMGLVIPPLRKEYDTLSDWHSTAFQLARRRLKKTTAAQIISLNLGPSRVSDKADAARRIEAMGLSPGCIHWENDQPFIEAIQVSPRDWCRELLAGIDLQLDTSVEATDLDHDVIIDCRGPSAIESIPIRTVRGQLSFFERSHRTSIGDSHSAAGSSYLIPTESSAILGATFQPDELNSKWCAEDHEDLVDKFTEEFGEDRLDKLKPSGGRVAFRACTPDYLPCIGPIPNGDQWRSSFADALRHGRQTQGLPDAQWQPRLYASTGHGSHGIAGSLLAAEVLAAHLCNEPSPISSQLKAAVQPARFLIRKMRKS